MCSRPIEKDGNTFACRTCNDCIATRRSGWVARGMAEMTDHKHALVVALTYGDYGHGKDASQIFCYSDVRDFIKRIASALRRRDSSARVRFLCAGEQGDRNGRSHWHLVLYSSLDLMTIGQFRGMSDHRKVVLTDPKHLLTVGKRKRRLDWSVWPHGFVTLQAANEVSMAYALSYCLKDQFTIEKSQGTMREAKAENFATGLFRMSKRPAIGEAFLLRKMEVLDATRSVLPSLQIKVPGLSGYWQPNGLFRKKLLWHLVALNRRAEWATGAPAPQWSALLSSCKDIESDMEILLGTSHLEKPESPRAKILKSDRQLESFALFREERAREAAVACFCEHCGPELSDQEVAAVGYWRLPNDGRADPDISFLYFRLDDPFGYWPKPIVCKYIGAFPVLPPSSGSSAA